MKYLSVLFSILILIACSNGESDREDETIAIKDSSDIDGDGQLDLLINNSQHYNAYIPTLYLSSSAEKGQLLKVAGMFTKVGC